MNFGFARHEGLRLNLYNDIADLGANDVLNQIQRSLRNAYGFQKGWNEGIVLIKQLFDFQNASNNFERLNGWATAGRIWRGDFGDVNITLTDLGNAKFIEMRPYYPGNPTGKRWGWQKNVNTTNPLTGRRPPFPPCFAWWFVMDT